MMNRIVGHHTGGGYVPNSLDLSRYHQIVDGDGAIHQGKHAIEANAPGKKLVSGRYAGHTARLNTGAIGLSMACMAGGDWHDPMACRHFPKPRQVDSFVDLHAAMCREYGIAVSRQTVLTHAEVQQTLGVTQAGKWDFDYDFMDRTDCRDPIVIGDKFRDRVSAALGRAGSSVTPQAPAPARPMPLLMRGAFGNDVRTLQLGLIRNGARIDADRAFGPATYAALVEFQRRKQLLPDGKAGPQVWAALAV